ncbi:hypothetical protein Tco_1040363 [Tanacetum coccineum]
MHRFADRFTDRRVEINNLMVLHDHPLVDYGKYALGCMTGADMKKCVYLKSVMDELLRSMEEKRQLMANYRDMCAEGDVVLRQSYKPESYGKLYYACPKSKPPKHFGCGFFLWKETRLRELMSSPGAPSYSAGHSTPPSYSSGPSTPPSYSSGPSTPTNYSLGSSRNRECSNCKHLRGKISVLKATMEMHMHPEQHTVNSAALFHEVLNEMEKLDLE